MDKIREDLERIKMVYLNKTTGRMVYTSPETVFKIMNAYIELLPSDASGWSFCLPWMFFARRVQAENENVNGDNFPCHPNDPTKWSAFPVGFRDCYYCGDTPHVFTTCPRKEERESQTRALV